MVIGSHVIFGAYGFWLPNDPRGSWSDFVGAWELYRYGRATRTTETRSLAARPHNGTLRLAAKRALRRPPVELTGIQARAVAAGFGEYVRRSGVVIWACAVLPDHLHLVLGRHRLRFEQLVIQLKSAATRQLIAEDLHPFPQAGRSAKCFARGAWKVFLDNERDIRRAIRYVEQNPLKEGKPVQRWAFVTPYVGHCGERAPLRSPSLATRRG
jgi:REP element-mobilizing transposase RayT